MKKAFDQTVRDIKREVNKKVLKVPSIEQKVLDATSNEPWGPHGSHLADIAQASRNYHEYQMIMAVIWKRINDTGKNWRHVYKALILLEYLVGHGSERVIDEIREHAYQIQTLSDFQYIDSSGRDQGSNVRKKSQSLVVLVNDKERIQEVRQKAAANRDKYRNTSVGGMYRPGSYSGSGGYGERYEDDRYDARYGGKDDERNGYNREREWGNRDDDRYGRYGDSYSRDGDRYGRDQEERYGRDSYRDDDYRGRSRSIDDYNYGSRSRSSDTYRDRAYEDDGQYSSRGSGARADDRSQDGSVGRGLERKYSEQNLGAPPSYEEAVGATQSPTHSERDVVEASSASAPKSSSPPPGASPKHETVSPAPPPFPASPPAAVPVNQETDGFDEFDPRGSFSAAPTSSSGAFPTTSSATEVDLLGSLSESFSSNSLALVPATAVTTTSDVDASANFGSALFEAASSVSAASTQTFDDPFGDGPFKAIPSMDTVQIQSHGPALPQQVPQQAESVNTIGESYAGATYMPSSTPNAQLSSTSTPHLHPDVSTSNQDIDILADILPPTGAPVPASQMSYHVQTGQPVPQTGFPPQNSQLPSAAGFPFQNDPTALQAGFSAQPGQIVPLTGFAAQPDQSSLQIPVQTSQNIGFPTQAGQAPQTSFAIQSGQPAPLPSFSSQMGSASPSPFQAPSNQSMQPPNANFHGGYSFQSVSTGPVASFMAPQISTGSIGQYNSGNLLSQPSSAAPAAPQMSLQSSQAQPSALVISASTGTPATLAQPAKEKFETKSTVWADTLSRGLVNLNISGPKINPLADIGIDFDAINRKEKRMEKQTTAPVTSTVTMGKAMGSGSGIGRAGAGALRPPPSNPMMGSGMGMGLGGDPGVRAGMGGYGAQPMGVGMGMNRPMNMGMGMGMGMGQGVQMQQPSGFPPGSMMPGGYNPMMGQGNYGQQPYGGGYR